MDKKTETLPDVFELSQDDEIHINEIFQREIVSKLKKLNARNGNLNCHFAGESYQNWNIQFCSTAAGFEIIAFEYDATSSGLDLDL